MASKPKSTDQASKGLIPPHIQLGNILSPNEHAELLAWALDNEQKFEPAKVFSQGGHTQAVNLDRRSALKLRHFGPLKEVLTRRLMERLPEIMRGTGYSGPEPTSLEFELNAYGEGGHFGAHMDVSAGPNRKPVGGKAGEDRILSAVYYFYTEPKGFAGGALRLFRLVPRAHRSDDMDLKDDDIVAYEPRQNSLVAFPSWAWHDVAHVSCPSGRFSDYRFGLNCWFCRTLDS